MKLFGWVPDITDGDRYLQSDNFFIPKHVCLSC